MKPINYSSDQRRSGQEPSCVLTKTQDKNDGFTKTKPRFKLPAEKHLTVITLKAMPGFGSYSDTQLEAICSTLHQYAQVLVSVLSKE